MIAICALAVAALLVGGVGYLIVIAPQSSKASSLSTQITNERALLTVDQGSQAQPVPFQASDLYRFAKAVPGRADVPGILLDLTRVAKASKVTIVSIRPSPQVPLTLGYSALPVIVVLSGKFVDITGFLARLRHEVRLGVSQFRADGRLFIANQVQLGGTTGTNVLSATVNLDAFVYAPVPNAPGATGTTGPTGAAGVASTGQPA
jgi:hypothetical protein